MAEGRAAIAKSVAKWLFLGFLIVLTVDYLRDAPEALGAIRQLSPTNLAMIAVLSLGFFYVNGQILRQLALPFSIDLSEHFRLSLASSFLNLVLPMRGGAVLRAVYMKRFHGLNYAEFLSSLLGFYIVVVVINSALGLAVFAWVYATTGAYSLTLIAALGGLLVGMGALVFGNFRAPGWLPAYLLKVEAGWRLIRSHPDSVLRLSMLALLQFGLHALTTWVAFRALGSGATVAQAAFVAVVSSFAVFITITPGSIGVAEGLFFLSATVLRIDPTVSLLAALTIRAVQSGTLILLGPFCYRHLARRLEDGDGATPQD